MSNLETLKQQYVESVHKEIEEDMKEGYVYSEERVQEEIEEFMIELDLDDKIHKKMERRVDQKKNEPKEVDNELQVFPNEGEKWEDTVERTLRTKEMLNDLGEGFSDEDWGEEEEFDEGIPDDEMTRRLVFKQFFDSYFSGSMFHVDVMIRKLRKFAGETKFRTTKEMDELEMKKELLNKSWEKKRRIRKKLKNINEIRRQLLNTYGTNLQNVDVLYSEEWRRRKEKMNLIRKIRDLYKDEKKDKKQFEEEKKKMEKIFLTRNELEKITRLEIEKNLPLLDDPWKERVTRTTKLLLEVWKDVGKNGMKFINMDQMKEIGGA
jgi:hypothetical protein